MKAGDTVIIRGNSTVYYVKTADEIRTQQAKDEARGRFFDDGGEPLIYSKIGCTNIKSDAVAMVMRTRGISWPHWTRRPTGLIECFATVNDVPRAVMLKKCDLIAQGDVPSKP